MAKKPSIEIEVPVGGECVRLGRRNTYDSEGNITGYYEDFADYDHAAPNARPKDYEYWLKYVEEARKRYDPEDDQTFW